MRLCLSSVGSKSPAARRHVVLPALRAFLLARSASPSRSPRWLRMVAFFFSFVFLWSMVLATPVQILAQEHLPSRTSKTPQVAAKPKDDPSWHTINYLNPPKSAKPSHASFRFTPPLSLLDEVGRLARTVTDSEATAWKQELATRHLAPQRNAHLHLWLGEYALAHDEQPEQALWHFRRVQQIVSRTDPAFGISAFDQALTLFYEGSYGEAKESFYTLLTSQHALAGVQRRHITLWYDHARACAGYHAEHAAAGIPEPPRLDPLCGAAALASCLRAQGQPSDKPTVLSAVRVSGRGSRESDLVAGAEKLGMRARIVSTDDAGLIALPKPVIAYVEHDHFISVVDADKEGVSYLCSDCGAWPGGKIHLIWKQWHKLEATSYVAIYKPESILAAVLPQLTDPNLPGAMGVHLAALRHSSALVEEAQQALLLDQLRSHVQLVAYRRQNSNFPEQNNCGFAPSAVRCPEDISSICCPDDDCPTCNGNPSAGDPVNMATGEESYKPEPDIVVYNPVGPSVAWSRRYDSLRGKDDAYQYDDFGMGWSTNFNVGVYDPAVTENWIVPQGDSGSLPLSTPPLSPHPGYTWDILDHTGTTVASSSSANGWGVAYDPNRRHLIVTAPGSAAIAENYLVRYQSVMYGGPYSTFFDVIASGSVAQNTDLQKNFANLTFVTVPISGSDAPATGLSWDILYNGATIATSTNPQFWMVYYTFPTSTDPGQPAGSGRLQVGAPLSAPLGPGYEVRFKNGASFSGTFKIVAGTLQPTTGMKYFYLANGARFGFTPSGIPSAAQPKVTCSVGPGVALVVEWDYDASDALGHFLLTLGDRTQLTTTTTSNVTPLGAAVHELAALTDRVGNSIYFHYFASGASGFPLLTSITNSANQVLLLLLRANDGTGNLISVTDGYGRTIYYHCSPYATQNVPQGFPQSFQELDHVSQISTGGNPPDHYVFGYQNINTAEGAEKVPFLNTITVPSPTGTGTATAQINYSSQTCMVANRVDANGIMDTYRIVDANHTQKEVYDAQGHLVWAQTFGYDPNMSASTVTDGKLDNNGHNTTVI
ncbi:MAG TPA: DUF6531 domain-containing protein, partial [Chthonomonadaceae bacterium]|nr:DUF6531 domain-containing protein [Chthonomonadaceae bacterium]